MDIESIHEVVAPLGERLECFLPADESFYDLKNAKTLRVNTFSDVMLKVLIEFSYDGKNKGIVTSQRSSSMWLSTKHEVPMRYVRLHIVNESSQKNNELTISCRLTHDSVGSVPEVKLLKKVDFDLTKTTPRGFEILPPPIEECKGSSQPAEDSSPSLRGKSPFRSFKKKLGNSPKSLPMRDPRLPEFIPQGSILVGGPSNTIKVLAKGVDGEYLMMKGEPQWLLPFPPTRLSEDSQNAMRLSTAGGWFESA